VRRRALRVERLEVLRRARRELLDLPLGNHRTRVVTHHLHHLVERGARGFLRHHPTDAMREHLAWKVQDPVHRMEVFAPDRRFA
jgi:hypothetical protein